MKKILILSALSLPFASMAGEPPENKVIYGEDNRHEVFDYAQPEIVELSRSTVALLRDYDLTEQEGRLLIPLKTFGEDRQMCSSERFIDQPAAAFCSGFLIAPNKVVTAGHCVDSESDCESVRFVFDFKMNDATSAQTQFTPEQVYACKKVLGHAHEGSGKDFAVIELDREVQDRAPLKLANNENLAVGDEILVIGHPSGLPTKITDSANVREVKTERHFFVANLDTYGGNSGSAVFNARTLEVEGILVRGEDDYASENGCTISVRVANDEGRGEDVTLISSIHENGFEATQGDAESEPTGEVRYVWLDSDMTCNEFHGDDFIREVSNHYCGRYEDAEETPTEDGTTEEAELRYVWLDSDLTCNEFQGNEFVREVPNILCGHGEGEEEVSYIWLDHDMTCNEFLGDRFVREVSNEFCGRAR